MHDTAPSRADRDLFAIGPGVMTGAIRRTAALGFQQRRLAIRQAGDQHAVVQQRQHHRQQGGFLTAVQAGGGGEHAGRFANQRAGQPQVAGAVEEVLQRRGHVAETRRAAKGEAGAVLQVIEGGVERTVFRDVRGDRLTLAGNRRYGTQARFETGLFDTAGNLPGHLVGRTVAAVIQNQNVRRAHGSSSSTFSGGRPITALSPTSRIGRSISFGCWAMASINCASLRLSSAS